MIELTQSEASQLKAGGCGKYLRYINRARRIYTKGLQQGGGGMTDSAFDSFVDNMVDRYVDCMT